MQHLKNYETNYMDETLELLKKNKHPLQNPLNETAYCVCPTNSQVFRGSNQMILQQANVVNGNPYINHISLHEMNLRKLKSDNKKLKCPVLYAGMDEKGNKMYTVIVPTKPLTRREQRDEDQINLLADKITDRMKTKLESENIGTQLGSENIKTQPALIAPTHESIKTPSKQEKQDVIIKNFMSSEVENYYLSLLSKTPYKPLINWKDKNTTEAIVDWVSNNSTQFIEIMDKAYKNIQTTQPVKQTLQIEQQVEKAIEEKETVQEKTTAKKVTAKKVTAKKEEKSNAKKTTAKEGVKNTAEKTTTKKPTAIKDTAVKTTTQKTTKEEGLTQPSKTQEKTQARTRNTARR